MLVVYGGLLLSDLLGLPHTPKGFIPAQDMGYLLVNVQLPDAASAERTRKVMDRVEKICMSTPGVKHARGGGGDVLPAQRRAPNLGSFFVILDDFPLREEPGLSATKSPPKLANCLPHGNSRGPGHRPAGTAGAGGRAGGRIQNHGRGPRRRRPGDAARQIDNLAAQGAGGEKNDRQLPPLVALSTSSARTCRYLLDLNRSQCMTMEVSLAVAWTP